MICADGTTEIIIPDGLFWWSDELDYEAVGQTEEESVDGALIVEPFDIMQRRMTLSPTTDNGGCLPLSTWKILRGWSNVKGKIMTNTFANGDSFSVIFARPAFKAAPLAKYSDRDPAEWWCGSIYFIINSQG